VSGDSSGVVAVWQEEDDSLVPLQRDFPNFPEETVNCRVQEVVFILFKYFMYFENAGPTRGTARKEASRRKHAAEIRIR
jgi:hypothetical protein